MPRHGGRIAALAFLISVSAGAVAQACTGAGVIIRIDGRPQDLVITRIEDGKTSIVSRPRVLEVVCQNDSVHVVGATFVTISIDGRGVVKVDKATDYRCRSAAARRASPATPTARSTSRCMPDMKRLPWNVRIKGAGDDFGFAVPALTQGGEKLVAGRRDLLVRLVGGTAPYKVEVRTPTGEVVASQSADTHEVVFHGLALAPRAYQIVATDSTPRELTAQVTAVDSGPSLDHGVRRPRRSGSADRGHGDGARPQRPGSLVPGSRAAARGRPRRRP